MNDPIKVLIVEDEALVALQLQRRLHQMGYAVCGPVASGLEAVDLAGYEQPDVALLDMGLAGEMDGLETARALLDQQPVHIIFFTGYADARTRERAAALRPAAFLVKPVSPDDVKAAIDSIFTSS